MRAAIGKVKIPVVNGAIEPPVWERHPQASNWGALIRPRADCEVDRLFLDSTDTYGQLFIDKLIVGEAVEFGADKVLDGPKGGKGTKRVKNRWFGVVRSLTADFVEIEQYSSEWDAFMETERARTIVQRGVEPKDVLLRKLNRLEAQREAINAEIVEFEAQLGITKMLEPMANFDEIGESEPPGN